MNNNEKIALFQQLNRAESLRISVVYDVLEQCDAIKTNYVDYSTTHPVDCDTELLRLPTADYDLCCALLTMLLREDYFCNGRFQRRDRAGQVKPIIERMITLLK